MGFSRTVVQATILLTFVSLIGLMHVTRIRENPVQRVMTMVQTAKKETQAQNENGEAKPAKGSIVKSGQGQEDVTREAKTKVIILFWNSYWIWSHFGMGVGNRGFIQAGCEMINCHTTNNRAKFKVADAIVFHGEDLGNANTIKELEVLKKFKERKRQEGSKVPLFIYFMKEPPHQGNKLNHEVYLDFFDLTVSFQPDSDVEADYGTLVPINSKKDPFWPKWRPFQANSSEVSKSNFASKSKDIAWIVSHCETDSHRERYVEALKQVTSLKIDVFGSCGSQSLPLPPRPEEKEYDRQANAQVETYKSTLDPYKFYLSFENTLCQDYITEKFFYTFASRNGPVPVVLGGLSAEDYSKVAPPHSYLHVDNFKKPEDLAKELERLSQNESAYSDYGWWKSFYKLETEWDNHKKAQCKLCKILNQILNGDREVRSYANMDLFWNTKSRCREPTF